MRIVDEVLRNRMKMYARGDTEFQNEMSCLMHEYLRRMNESGELAKLAKGKDFRCCVNEMLARFLKETRALEFIASELSRRQEPKVPGEVENVLADYWSNEAKAYECLDKLAEKNKGLETWLRWPEIHDTRMRSLREEETTISV